MANEQHLDLLKQGVETWNQWRKEHSDVEPDLNRAYLTGANLRQANLLEVDLFEATLFRADLSGANLSEANLFGAAFTAANLFGANLTRANLTRTTLSEADLSGADLSEATIVRTQFAKAILTDCRIYGISAWDVHLEGATQSNLVITLTDPSSAPYEVASIVPQCVVPVQPLLSLQPLIVAGKEVERHEFAMFEDLRRRYRWVLPTVRYQDVANLLVSINEQIIEPAEQKGKELAQQK